jgi:uncharacterized protein
MQRPRRRLAIVPFAFFLALLSLRAAAADKPVPFLSGRVVDEAGMLPADARQRIEEKLAAFEKSTGAQVAVLTVASLDGDPIEDYSIRVVETWKLGKKEKDNGVLLLVAEQDRKMRIEVGYGLEGELTDLESGRIVDNVIRPDFQKGDFAAGIEHGVDAILSALGGGEVPAEPPARPASKGGPDGMIFIIFIVVFLYIFLRSRGGGRRGPWGGGGFWGGGFGGGSFGGGRGGGGGFGGGGFSGGGGSFGGGGASGSW